MMKTKVLKFAIAAGVMALQAAGVWAQESNRSASTAGRLGTEVDDFLSTTDFMNVHTDTRIFGYTRLGHGSTNGHLELGAGVKATDNLYIGALYNGWFMGETAKGQSKDISIVQGGEPKEKRAWTEEADRSGYPLEAGILVGLGGLDGLGIKLGLTDTLKITGNLNTTGIENEWKGAVKPSLDVGFNGKIPVLTQARLSFGINRADTIVLNGDGLDLINGTSLTTSKITSQGSSAIALTGGGYSRADSFVDLRKEGTVFSYLEPELYVQLALPLKITLENTLGVRLYNNNAAEAKYGEDAADIAGVAFWKTTFDANDKTKNSLEALWDNKFYLTDTLQPSYTLKPEDAEAAFQWRVKFVLPLGIETGSDVYSAKYQDASGTITAKEFYNQSTFTFKIDPVVKAAVAYKPELFSGKVDLHAGTQVNVLSWALTTTSSVKKEDAPDAFYDSDDSYLRGKMDALINGGSALSAGNYALRDTSESVSVFTGPKMDFGAGFTVYLGPCALDFMVLKAAKPTVDGMIYEAVSGGLNAQLVLSAKM